MKVIAGQLPNHDRYTVGFGSLSSLAKTWPLNQRSVEDVSFIDSGKSYNYGDGAIGILSGAAFAGPVGALIGGLIPKVFKENVVRFVIKFRNGDQAHCVGTVQEYEKVLKFSLQQRSESLKNTDRLPPSLPDRDRLRAGLLAKKTAAEQEKANLREAARAAATSRKITEEQKAEREERKKAVSDGNLPFREHLRLMNEIDSDYR